MSKLFTRYLISASLINGALKSAEVYDCKVKRPNRAINDMLLTEKLCIVSLHTIAGAYVLPIIIYNNLHKFEMKMRNKNENDYYEPIIYNKHQKDIYYYLFNIW